MAVEDDKRYWVTVNAAVYVMPKMVWRPGNPIQSQGSLINQLMAKPEYVDVITVGNEVQPDEVM
jgi:hypothetical protein